MRSSADFDQRAIGRRSLDQAVGGRGERDVSAGRRRDQPARFGDRAAPPRVAAARARQHRPRRVDDDQPDVRPARRPWRAAAALDRADGRSSASASAIAIAAVMTSDTARRIRSQSVCSRASLSTRRPEEQRRHAHAARPHLKRKRTPRAPAAPASRSQPATPPSRRTSLEEPSLPERLQHDLLERPLRVGAHVAHAVLRRRSAAARWRAPPRRGR